MSVEQSNKTAAIACLVIAAYLMRKPCVVIAKDGYSNVNEMQDKLKKWLCKDAREKIEIKFLAGGKRQWDQFADTDLKRASFRRLAVLQHLLFSTVPVLI